MIEIAQKDWIPWPQYYTASITCPFCKRKVMLSAYKIATDTGIVTPSVHCPHCKKLIGDLRLKGYPAEISI